MILIQNPLTTLAILSIFIGLFVLYVVVFTGILMYKVFKNDKTGYLERKIYTVRETNEGVKETYTLELVIKTRILGFPQRIGSTIVVYKDIYDQSELGSWVNMKVK